MGRRAGRLRRLLLRRLLRWSAALVVVLSVVGVAAPTTVRAAGAAAVAWGDSVSGQLGIGSSTDSSTPVQVSGLTTGVVAVAAGGAHSLALLANGTVMAWGSNVAGQLGDRSTVDRATPVAVAGLTGVTAIAAGDAHSLALLSNGTVMAWGSNDFGQLGDGTTTDRLHPVAVGGLATVTAIAAGGNHSLALRSNGTIAAWGEDDAGQLGTGSMDSSPHPTAASVSGVSTATAIAAGASHSLALFASGTVKAWGSDSHGQLGDGGSTNSGTPVGVSGIASQVTAIAAGAAHSLAVAGGAVVAWGSNGNGQLGNNTTTDASTPVTVSGVNGTPTSVAAGGAHSLALTSAGAVFSWGSGRFGQLGTGSTADATTAQAVSGVSGVTAIRAGGGHSLLLEPGPGAAPSPGAPLLGSPADPAIPGPTPPGGGAAPPNYLATPNDVTTFPQPQVAADPTRPGHLAASYEYGFSGSKCYLDTSSDGGRSWAIKILAGPGGIFPLPSPATAPGLTPNTCFVTSVAFGADGTLYVLMLGGTASTYTSMFLSVSIDGGLTFRAAQQVDLDEPALSATGPLDFTIAGLAVDTSSTASRGNVYIVYLRAVSSFSRATTFVTTCRRAAVAAFEAGAPLSCGGAVQVSRAPTAITNGQGPQPAVGPDGHVYVAWLDLTEMDALADNGGFFPVMLVSSTDQGTTFGAPQAVDRVEYECAFFLCPAPYPALYPSVDVATGPSPGLVYVVSSGLRHDGGWHTVVDVSLDGGASWASRTAVGRLGQGYAENAGWLGVAPNGRLDVEYYGIAPDGTENVYVTSSSDGGFTFGPSQLLSDTPSSEAIQSQGFTDDYDLGLASCNAGVYAAWDDSRRGTVANDKTDVFTATTVAPGVSCSGLPSGGYWLVAADGGIFPFGNAGGFGSTGNVRLNQPVVGMAATPDGRGYWLVAADGGIFPFGDAGGFGSTGNVRLNQPVVGMAATPDGGGYWLVAADGGIFPFGDAAGYGSTGAIGLNKPMVGMAATPDGGGYWLVAADGGVFPFGDAVGYGSTGALRLNQPMVGMAATPGGGGYWLVAADGGIFPFGDASGLGSMGGMRLNRAVVGMATAP